MADIIPFPRRQSPAFQAKVSHNTGSWEAEDPQPMPAKPNLEEEEAATARMFPCWPNR